MEHVSIRQLDRQELARIPDPLERRTAIALHAAQIGVFEFEPQTERVFWDDRLRELWGVTLHEDITYDTVIAQVHPEDRDAHNAQTQLALDPSGPRHFDLEYRVLPRNGHPMRWIHTIADCHFDGDRPVRLVGTVQDVTARRMAEDHTKMLHDELEHRVKNMLATVISVVKLSRRGQHDVNDYAAAIEARLLSMSRSHDLLRANQWQPVDLLALIDREVSSFLGAAHSRVTIAGSSLILPARHVLTMSMALHELFANASHHGALQTETGTIAIAIERDGENARFRWAETAGHPPPQDPTERSGFGVLLLTQAAPAELMGKAEYKMRPGGLHYGLDFPVDPLVQYGA
ncbi:HWE histidine kinase domain-containing protein [Yoonia sp. BS5-3]|uniref:histidine kinase n=1 Tax=Yoonia phaeophyticola TaxID=3137369 RepID=A0ABZ2V1L7_9RHOB